MAFINEANNEWRHDEVLLKMQHLEQALEKRDHLDSLYREHLDKCSFIAKDDIGVGYRGTLYSKYARSDGRYTTN